MIENGYDELTFAKENNLKKLISLRNSNPNITRKQLAKELSVSLRTVTRYQSELKKGGRLL